jgi:hypothetical protein
MRATAKSYRLAFSVAGVAEAKKIAKEMFEKKQAAMPRFANWPNRQIVALQSFIHIETPMTMAEISGGTTPGYRTLRKNNSAISE